MKLLITIDLMCNYFRSRFNFIYLFNYLLLNNLLVLIVLFTFLVI